MVVQKDSVVTPERFAQGISFQQFLDQINGENIERFHFNYDNTEVSEADRKALRDLVAKPNGPKKMLVLAEAFCPDVFRGLPVLTRMAETSGLEMRIFFRDQNQDIMNEFLNKGEFQSIPTAVFYTSDHEYIWHFIERPQKANDEMHYYREIRAGRSQEEAKDDMDTFQKGPIWGGWRDATIKEIIKELQERVH